MEDLLVLVNRSHVNTLRVCITHQMARSDMATRKSMRVILRKWAGGVNVRLFLLIMLSYSATGFSQLIPQGFTRVF